MGFAKLKDYIYSVACVVWLWVIHVTIKSSQKHHIWSSQSNLTSCILNVIFRLRCLGQLNDFHFLSQLGTTPLDPMAQKPIPAKKHLITKLKFRFNIINKLKPTINSGSLLSKHLVTKFKFIDSMLTNLNPQSIVVLLCLYKEWHHFRGTNYLYPSFQGYITFVSLLFPLTRPHKVVH